MSDESSSQSGAGPSGPGEDEERPEEADSSPDESEGTEANRPEGEADDEEERRPISVRDLMPEPSPERRRTEERGTRQAPAEAAPSEPREEVSPEPAAPSEPAVPSEEEEAAEAEEEDAPARPTPVRVAMDAPPPGDSRPVQALPSRSFEARGEEWIVRIAGRTITGTRPDAGAHLMHLEFSRADEPEAPVRELLTVDRPLDALYKEDLEEFLDRSRPARDPLGEGG